MKKLSGILFLTLAGVLAHVVTIHAAADTPQVYSLGEIVVTTPTRGVEDIATVRTVDATQLELQNARSLDEALQMVPGIAIRTGGKGVPRLDMRGMRTRHVLLLLDGIPFNSTYDGQFDLSLIPTENIERIKVSYGGASLLYGQGGLGGVINIITKRARPGLHARATQEIGQHIDYNGRYTLSMATDRVDLFVSGSLYRQLGFELSDDYQPTPDENGDRRDNSDYTRKNGFFNLGLQLTDRLQMTLSAAARTGSYGLPPNSKYTTDDPFASGLKYERMDDYDGYNLQLALDWDAPGRWDFRGWGFVNTSRETASRYDDETYSDWNDTSVKKTYHLNRRTSISGLHGQARCSLGRAGQVSFAAAGESHDWREDGVIRDRQVAVGGVPPSFGGGGGGGDGSGGGGGGGGGGKIYYLRAYDEQRDLRIYSLAAEYSCTQLRPLTLVLGLSKHWLALDSGNDDDDWNFLTGLEYRPWQATCIHGAISRKTRFPSLSQLYDAVYGNPDLHTERAYNYEAGIEQQLPGQTSLSVTGFHSDVEGFIQKDDFTDLYENRDRYRYRGVELSIETRCLPRLWLRGTYTYTHSDDSADDQDAVQYTPRDKVTLQASYHLPHGLTLYASLLHVNRQYHYSKTTPADCRQLNEYTLVDCKVSQDLVRDRIQVYIGVDNLGDIDYETSYGYPQAGRFLYAGLTLRY